MRVDAMNPKQPTVRIELEESEAQHLLQFLLHAKFSDDVRIEIAGSPTMQMLLRALMGAQSEQADWTIIHERGGLAAPRSFSIIEEHLKRSLAKEDVSEELEEWLFPFTWVRNKP